MAVKTEKTDAKLIGFLADTHWRANQAASRQLLDAFQGVDLIVHLGDVGQDAPLQQLREVAPVMAPKKSDALVLEAGALRIGMVFDITKPDKAVLPADDGLTLPEALEDAIRLRFGEPVAAVAFAGTHRQLLQEHAGIVFFNPGSPTLPSDRQGDDDMGSVALMELGTGKPEVRLIRLSRA